MNSEIFAENKKNKIEPKTLYLVTTPIGNLWDISHRALKVLEECDFVAAEDTRNTLKLLTLYGIKKELVSYHEHNKSESGRYICGRLMGGESCALVTDAGMPGISDPGEDIVRLCSEYHLNVTAVPGPCACVTAISLSALSTSRFVFEGFIPVGGRNRKQRLSDIARERRTVVLYEAPHKLIYTLNDLLECCGANRRVALCRELTKLNEEILRTTLGDAVSYYSANAPRGEYVLVLEGADEGTEHVDTARSGLPHTMAKEARCSLAPAEHAKYYEDMGYSHMDAIKAAAADRGLSKGSMYKLLEKEKGKI